MKEYWSPLMEWNFGKFVSLHLYPVGSLLFFVDLYSSSWMIQIQDINLLQSFEKAKFEWKRCCFGFFVFFLVNLVPKGFYLFLIRRLAKWNIVIKLLAFHNKNGLHFRNHRNTIPLVFFLLWRYCTLLKFKTTKNMSGPIKEEWDIHTACLSVFKSVFLPAYLYLYLTVCLPVCL